LRRSLLNLLLLELLIQLEGSLVILKDCCIEILLELVSILAMHDYPVLRLPDFLSLLESRKLTLGWGCNDVIGVHITILPGRWSCNIFCYNMKLIKVLLEMLLGS
jgi:hypothetical protein